MLKFDIRWLAPICLLSSDRLLQMRFDDYFSSSYSLENTFKENIERAFNDYQPYLKSHLRKEDIHLACREWLDEKGCFDTHFLLRRLHHYFLSWCGNCFEVKAERLEEWLSLLSILDPAWIIGIGYVDLLKNQVFLIDQLITTLVHQCPSALPKRFDGRGIADNHVHLNGNGHASLSLYDMALYLAQKPDIKASKWPYRPECSTFNSNKQDISKLPIMFNHVFTSLAKSIWQEDEQKFFSWETIDYYQLSNALLVTLEKQTTVTHSQTLLAHSHLTDFSDAIRWLLLAISLLLQSSEENATVKTKTDIFINLSHLLRNYMIVSGTGLGHFVNYFGFTLRKPKILNYQSHTLSHDFCVQTHREFRVSTAIVLKQKKKSKIKLKPNMLTELAKELLTKKLDSKSHFVIHFSRSTDPEKPNMDRYQLERRNRLKNEVRLIQQFFSSATYSQQAYELTSPPSNKAYVDLRALIRGFDVAGNENDLPIEIFAPTLRVLRSGMHKAQSSYETRLRQPFLTIHAGEDYSHLLSGLRSIDEAVLFCNFKPGDRLGHALALGVDVYQWAQRQQRCYLTVAEHLDNLVWLYFQGLELLHQFPDFNAALCAIENKIHHWINHLYQDQIAFSLNDLHKAWQLRRNCPVMQESPCEALGAEKELWLPDFQYLNTHSQGKAFKLWQQYLHDGSVDKSSRNARTYDVISIDCTGQESLPVTDNSLSEMLTNTELKLMHAVQDLLIERYSKRQIVIEACPTSNIFIGRFEQYSEHPIFRWNPPTTAWLNRGEIFNKFGIRKGPITVCVNTDDAGLMPTTIENEHRVLKEAAINHYAVGGHDADLWIDNIRQKGVDLFKSNHLNWNNQYHATK